jgi:excisionase family DNA binding protein
LENKAGIAENWIASRSAPVQNSIAMTEWISTKTAMQLLGVGSTTVKRWADDGTLASMRTPGGHRRFRRVEVERLLRQQPATGKDSEIDEWINMLIEESDVLRIRGEIYVLRDQLGGWYRATDFLDNVMREICTRRSNDDEFDAQSVIAAGRLGLARTTIEAGVVSGETITSQLT